jgi:hypothetical protein
MKILEKLDILWECGRWDGPLSGICELDARKHYFNCLTESFKCGNVQCDTEEPIQIVYGPNEIYKLSYHSRVRVFGIYRLTDDEIVKQNYWHEEFRKYVGTHTSYEEGKMPREGVKPRAQHGKFYDRKEEYQKDYPQLTDDKLIALYVEHYIDD